MRRWLHTFWAVVLPRRQSKSCRTAFPGRPERPGKAVLLRLLLAGLIALAAGVWPARAADKKQDPTVRITLYPASEPDPALKYQLLPPLLDRRPGNAALHYCKAPHEQTRTLTDQKFWDSIMKRMEMPLAELRKQKPPSWPAGSGSIFEALQRGARCDSCDWDYPIREGDPYSILLPEVGGMRNFARLMAVRVRLQMAEGKYEDAVRSLQVGYAMARHVAQAPILVNALVGNSIAAIMDRQVETFIQQPDAPNLYWALSTLPRPLVDFRPGFEMEAAAFYLEFPELRDLEKKQLSADQWRDLLNRFVYRAAQLFAENQSEKTAQPASQALIEQGYPRAKRALIEWGYPAKTVDAMPVAQVILLYTTRTCDQLRDESFKWLLLPYPEARQGIAKAEQILREAKQSGREIFPIVSLLFPAVSAVKKAEVQAAERRLAALRILEAMRLYGAKHQGTLPSSLADITEVPIPADPLAGQPFGYRRDGQTAILESAAADAPPLRYHIQFAGKKKQP